MKKFLKYLMVIILFISMFAFAKTQDTIEGYWLNEEKDGKVEIYKRSDGKYYGKIVWLKEPNKDGKPKLDNKNKDEKLRNQTIIGLNVLKGFTKDGELYTGGTIYDPRNGKTYSCKITPIGSNILNIRGFIGISLIGRTTTFTRTTK